MLKESIELHRQGRFDEAEQGYRERLVENPNDARAMLLLGTLRYQRGDTPEAERLLTRAHELAPEDGDIELGIAAMRFREGDPAGAKPHFERALTLDPNLAGAHAGMGQIALLEGDRARAEQHFRIALRAGEEPHALAGLGALLLERGDADGALRHLTRAADLAQNDAMIQMLLGQAFMKRGTPAFAEQALRNALQLRPDMHQARFWLGGLLLETDRFDEADTCYRELLPVAEYATLAQLGLADVARTAQRFDDAVMGYRAVLAERPAHTPATRALAWTLAQQGRHDEALATYDAQLAQTPDDRELRVARADFLMMIGRHAEAAHGWQGVLDANPDDLEARHRLALLSEQLGQLDDARRHADAVLAVRRRDADMLLLRARAALREGDPAATRAALDKLDRSRLDAARSQQAAHLLGHAHDRAGDAAAAVASFAEVQRDLPVALPPLHDPNEQLPAALDEAPGAPWPQAPVLLLGTPGSGVEQVAALLADQPGLVVLRDRAVGLFRDDDFNQPRFAYYCGELGEVARETLRERYLAPLRVSGVATDRPIVDWLPRWDAHLLALIRRAMPGTRLLIVDSDPRDALVNWLGFGAAAGFGWTDAASTADWLLRARRHLAHGADLDEPRRLRVDADALLADRGDARAQLAHFLGLDALQTGANFASARGGLGGAPTRFEPGHWKVYREALADAFRRFDEE